MDTNCNLRPKLSPGVGFVKSKSLVWGMTAASVRKTRDVAPFSMRIDHDGETKPAFICLTVGLLGFVVVALGSAAQAGIVAATYDAALSSANSDNGTFPTGPNALVAARKLSPDIETGSTLAQAEGAKFTAGTLGGWATNSEGSNYFAIEPAPILTFNLGTLDQLSNVLLWQYDDNGNGNQLKGFSMAFSTDGVNFTSFQSIGSLAAGAESAQVFSLANIDAQYVEIRLDSNYKATYGANGGDRVGLGQIRFDGQAVAAVPEPNSLLLLGVGSVIALLWVVARHIKNRSTPRPASAATPLI